MDTLSSAMTFRCRTSALPSLSGATLKERHLEISRCSNDTKPTIAASF